MAFYAEMKRRHWYCVNGWNAILWYSDYLYDEWWNSLTDEQREKILERRRKRKEQRAKEAEAALARLLAMTSLVGNMGGNNYIERKYHGVYDKNGFPKI